MIDRDEELREKYHLEEMDAKSMKTFDLIVTRKEIGTVSVEARNLEEAKELVDDMDDDDIDWFEEDIDIEEDC